jgi:hypothetical protein
MSKSSILHYKLDVGISLQFPARAEINLFYQIQGGSGANPAFYPTSNGGRMLKSTTVSCNGAHLPSSSAKIKNKRSYTSAGHKTL